VAAGAVEDPAGRVVAGDHDQVTDRERQRLSVGVGEGELVGAEPSVGSELRADGGVERGDVAAAGGEHDRVVRAGGLLALRVVGGDVADQLLRCQEHVHSAGGDVPVQGGADVAGA
jgi:hypothetical protein